MRNWLRTEKRILAFDYGEKRIGVAITDPLCIFATGLPTIHSDASVLKQVQNILDQYDVIKIVIGLPLSLKGERGEIAKQTERFAASLKSITSIPIILWDERFTSSLASQTIRDLGVNKKRRRDKAKVDELAAIHLLQNYLSTQGITL